MITGEESSGVADGIFEGCWYFNSSNEVGGGEQDSVRLKNSTTVFMLLLLPHAPSLDIHSRSLLNRWNQSAANHSHQRNRHQQ